MKANLLSTLASLSLIVIPTGLFSQSDSLLARWAEFLEEDAGSVEIVSELFEDPVNINTAGRAELLSIPFITAEQADSIIARRVLIGRFKNKRQLLPVLGKDTYNLVKPLISAREVNKYAGKFIHRNYYKLEKIEQIENGYYQGNRLYDYNKVILQFASGVKAGLISQKDAGEASPFDFFSGYLQYLYNNGNIVLGNFYMKFGQGLTFSNPFSRQKTAAATLPFRITRNGGRATLSSAENTNHFGLYSEAYWGGFNWYLFLASNKRDAQFNAKKDAITGFDYDGYHRSISEINNRGILTEQLLGASVNTIINNDLMVGALAAQYKYDPGLNPSTETIGESKWRRQYFHFTGESLLQYSLYYRLQIQQLELAGEASFSVNGDPGFLQSVFFDYPTLKFGIKYWRLGLNFQSPSGRVFDNPNPFPRAEEGVYVGLTFKPEKKLQINLYKFVRKNLWRSYFNSLPLKSDEWMLQGEYAWALTRMLARFRYKRSENFISGLKRRQYRSQAILRLQAEVEVSPKFTLKTRWAYTNLDENNQQGAYIFQDFKYRLNKIFYFSTRITFFRTTSYDARLYEYESDLPGTFSNYALFGEGKKWYFLVYWKLYRFLELWFKFRYQQVDDLYPKEFGYTDTAMAVTRMARVQLRFSF